MKPLLLAVALLGTALLGTGLCAPPHSPPRAVLARHPSNSNFPHPHFPRPNFPHPNRNWDHGYWRGPPPAQLDPHPPILTAPPGRALILSSAQLTRPTTPA